MKPASDKPSVVRIATGFVLTTLAISSVAGFSFVASIWILEAPVDDWRPGEILGGALLVSVFAAPIVFVGQFLLALPTLIMLRRTGLLASRQATVALGFCLGFPISGLLNGLLLGFEWPGIMQLALTGAVSGAIGGLVWWQLVEQYHFRSSDV